MDVYEIIGYVGSILVAFSLTMSSIVKLRWYNLAGSAIFSLYGFLIGSLPVAFLNLFIALTNIYFLGTLYSRKELFKILMVRPDNYYLEFFLDFYQQEIRKFFPDFHHQKHILTKETERPFALIILRDAAVAGVVLGRRTPAGELIILLDFVVPQYRDMKPGKFLYHHSSDFFKKHKIHKIVALPKNKPYYEFLKKLEFTEDIREEDRIYLVRNI